MIDFPRTAILTMVVVAAFVVGVNTGKHPIPAAAVVPVPVRVVAFQACGDTAGMLVIQSDGSSVWHRPPFHGLAEVTVRIPDDEKMAVDHCPPTY